MRRPPGYGGCAVWSLPNSPQSDDRDDIRVLVRRATLSLDSDLTPDADLLVGPPTAPSGWRICPLPTGSRRRRSERARDQRPIFVRAHALSWLSRGEEADAVLAEMDAEQLTDSRSAPDSHSCGPAIMLWALGDPDRAKELIDDARGTTPPAGPQLHRRLPHGVLVCDGPA